MGKIQRCDMRKIEIRGHLSIGKVEKLDKGVYMGLREG